MAKIKIITDSSCDLPKEIFEKSDIKVLPLNILLGDDSYVDGENITPDEILEWSEKTKSTPKTSSPSLQRIYELIESYAADGTEAIFIGISEKISTTLSAVELAVKNYNADRIKVVDSKSLSGGLGLLVLKAAEMSDNGCTLEEIYYCIKNAADNISTSFVVDTLQHLYYGGRCSSLSAFLGSTLKIKPCISLIDGKMQVTNKYRGSNQKVMLNYAQEILENITSINNKRIVIAHTGCSDDTIEALKNMIKERDYFEEIIVSRCSCVITSHGGPRTLGLFYEKI
jgi:DegV family protein with EDD domain